MTNLNRSLCRVCNIVFPTHRATHKHHIANHTAKNGYRHIWLRAYPRSISAAEVKHRNIVIGKYIGGRKPQHLTGILPKLRHYRRLKIIAIFAACCS
ncbi:MAG: hypothetical protein FWF70_00200 [Bacteroidetes bacterium]|nr:hypothetical protein [Bacteroidota bacterium]MCL1969638.1 hypothetical protein [Bacteroidota bacterium]